MKTIGKDKILVKGNMVKHESAGGFLFYKEPNNEPLVALLKKVDDAWYMPKGHIKDGETVEETAIRELMEELSLEEKPRLVAKAYVDSYTFSLPDDPKQHSKIVHVFVFEADTKVNIKPEVNESFEDAKWVTISEAKKMLAFDQKSLEKAIDLYLKTK